MQSENEKVYGKYRILDAKTGEEKKGRYFVLRLDAKDDTEARIVRTALLNYAAMQNIVGRHAYCNEIVDYIEDVVREKKDEIIAAIRGEGGEA